MKTKGFTLSAGGVLTAALTLALGAMPAVRVNADEAQARELVKAMSDYLAAQDRLAFAYDATLEVVTKEDQKLGIASSGTVSLDRPGGLRMTRANGFVDFELVFDGTTLTLLGKNAGHYTQVAAPGTTDQLLDELRDTHGWPMPAADLLSSDTYAALMDTVTDVKDLGSGMIGGVECDWLAFRADEVDWQIWIAQGEEPYPCRYVITSTDMPHAPQFAIQLRDWTTGDAVPADDFAFAAPDGATEIAIEELRTLAGDLPENFAMESN